MPSPNPEYINELIRIVAEGPFPKHMAMKLASIEFDKASIELALDTYHLQPYGIVHGGVLATLIDTATFWAAFLRIPEDAALVNIDLKLNYLKPVISGKLIAKGRCVKTGRTICYSEATVFDQEGDTIAHGTSSLMVLPGKGMKINISKFR